MSERILKALIQLFALIAKVDNVGSDGRSVVKAFLNQQLNAELVEDYLNLFEEYLEKHQKISKRKEGKERKRTSVNSVKVLRICSQINEELGQKQKFIVLLRLLEFVFSETHSDQEIEFVKTVASTFNISDEELNDSMEFVLSKESELPDRSNFLIISKTPQIVLEQAKNLLNKSIEGYIKVQKIESMGVYLAKYDGDESIFINGQTMEKGRVYLLAHGSSFRNAKMKPIYFSDISSFFRGYETKEEISFVVDKLHYDFPAGNTGIHDLDLVEKSGGFVGIMGASGAGKSTFLSLLNGGLKPTSGSVKINGIDIHNNPEELEGVIGHVSQDDLLMEDLTVFENLYFNARLCFDSYPTKEVVKKVVELLKALGLYEIRRLKIGSPLNKKISGGQRKRLNIGLELIREPQVLFVDEPTSGLSSRDSENIMDLLKEMSLSGKLVFVVIHQPSSDIFKMFDNLLVLDTGGYMIYHGNPIDSVIYFKKAMKHVNADESECYNCGNVNPEQVFNIIETKVVDEYGNTTRARKFSPKVWSKHFYEQFSEPNKNIKNTEIPEGVYRIPRKISQFRVFFARDVLSKISNTQYLLINFLEGPFLAFILAYLVKYYSAENGLNLNEYVFRYNDNMTAYLFMSVVVALFMGLTVSAEEIIRDRKILKRESFLNLSRFSYLSAKVSIMFIISAIQTLCYVLVGNMILGIDGMYMDYWLVLFVTSCFANMLGLNISSTFNSVVTIYILIPILLIPQLLLSGVIVKFDKLNPTLASQTVVPVTGELMASRWAFEALAVNQFKENVFEREFYSYNQQISQAKFKRNFWLSEVKKRIETCKIHENNAVKAEVVKVSWEVVRAELIKELDLVPTVKLGFNIKEALKFDKDYVEHFDQYLGALKTHYNKRYNENSKIKNEMVVAMQNMDSLTNRFIETRNNYHNESLSDLVLNGNSVNKIIEYEGGLVQKTDPIYKEGEGLRAHFFAPNKLIFGKRVDTFWVNMMVLFLYTGVLFVMLYFDVLKRIVDKIESVSIKLKLSKEE
ncbi:MAG: ABC-type multidrug transport system ATPase subunit [Saprospiraceae bacterium]|jgi:ABC-type multidrug transport system ATPase subunit